MTSFMLAETSEAPEAVERLIAGNSEACRALGERLRRDPPRFVVTCARGSSDSAATYAKYLIEIALGTVVASVGPSISSVYGARPRMGDALFLAISQSGRSPDIVALAETARADGALTVALVNDVASPLAERCEIVLPLHAGPEKSVAATKSYIASLAGVLQLVAAWSGEKGLETAIGMLPDALRDALGRAWTEASQELSQVANLYVVGRGPGFATALEGAIKIKETCGFHAEALSAAELMHGPMTLAGPDFPVLMFSQDDPSLPSLSELAKTLTRRGVPLMAAGPVAKLATLPLPSAEGLHPFVQPIALIQSFYRMVEELSRMRGRDPDKPPHLLKVTETI